MSAFSRGSESTFTNNMQKCYKTSNKLSENTVEDLSEITNGTDCKDDPMETTMDVVEMVSDLLLKNIEFLVKIKIGGKLLHFESTSLVRGNENSTASNQSKWSEVVLNNTPSIRQKRHRPSYVKRLDRRKAERDKNNSGSILNKNLPCSPCTTLKQSTSTQFSENSNTNDSAILSHINSEVKYNTQEQETSIVNTPNNNKLEKQENKYVNENTFDNLKSDEVLPPKETKKVRNFGCQNEKTKEEVVNIFERWLKKSIQENSYAKSCLENCNPYYPFRKVMYAFNDHLLQCHLHRNYDEIDKDEFFSGLSRGTVCRIVMSHKDIKDTIMDKLDKKNLGINGSFGYTERPNHRTGEYTYFL